MGYQPFRVTVKDHHRVSPHFIRVTFAGEQLADFGPAGNAYDLRIKLLFPNASGELPDIPAGANWYEAWCSLPESERGPLRTFSVRELTRSAQETTLTVDFVNHLGDEDLGPAATWALHASAGDELIIIGPDLNDDSGSGIEFAPTSSRQVRLFGDETAAPAIARILEDLPDDAYGEATIEVPISADILNIAAPEGVLVRWVPRNGSEHGSRLKQALSDLLGPANEATPAPVATEQSPLVWETPRFSANGEPIIAKQEHQHRPYYWIAGESGMVICLRRQLIRGHGIDRSNVSFMGYWKHGVAMGG
ncbi:siderophore-interacting protein [Corynebacterium alimapuense]|uniref:Siderophore-interacting protein n=1 Tax=Corynebacterium alimapuense TaxID=1576874 RepID=A0A3M8K8L8_9CORY|nr:siderophore-interacting protein [Corynebacterium alimapuense]RNE48808.1 siderophore-interacting protein [Corynebacterium alimapuense]